MVKTRITSRGIIQEAGSGLVNETGAQNVSPFTLSTTTRTADAVLTTDSDRVQILSASQGVLTVTMPTLATSVGSIFVLRSTSPSAHIVTASADAGNTFTAGPARAGYALNITGSNYNQLTFGGLTGQSIALMSDGVSWLVLAASGSFTSTRLAV